MWRWSIITCSNISCNIVFSTYVEVIPTLSDYINSKHSVLHVCGGDPSYVTSQRLDARCSPRMWRWSFFQNRSSDWWLVFSTYVEVILAMATPAAWSKSVLHVCGGDPMKERMFIQVARCSPRMWRWSWNSRIATISTKVFSTYVR